MFIGNANIFGLRPAGGAPSFTNTNSLLFDGIDEYVDCGVVSALNATQNFSISCWVKANTSADGEILGTYTAAGNMIGLNFAVASNVISISVRNGAVTYSSHSATLNTGQWYHVVMVFDGTQGTATDRIKAYLDGSNVARSGGLGTNPTTSNTSTKSFDIGGLPDASVYRNVYMDEVAIFDYSLDASQVTSIYNSGQPNNLNDLATPPVHWWRMGDGDTFPTINDVGTTGGNNGTMTNQEVGDIVTVTPPKFSLNSILFDGVDEGTTTSATLYNGQTNYSWSYWFKCVEPNGGNDGYDIAQYATDFIGFWNYAGTTRFLFAGGVNARFTNASVGLVSNTWYHAVITYDGSGATNSDKAKIYLNGVSQTLTFTGTIPSSLTTNALTTHRIPNYANLSGIGRLNGNLDEVAHWSGTTLNATQASEMFNAGQPIDITSYSPTHWWRFGDGTGDSEVTIYDQIGSADLTGVNLEAGDIVTDTP